MTSTTKTTTNHEPVITVAWNPIRKRYERVYAEDDTTGSRTITMYWCDAFEKYVTIPE